MHDRLKQCRLQHDFSQKYVAMTIGVSKPIVSQWEAGVKRPSIENLISLAALYETTIDYLVGNSDADGIPKPSADALNMDERQLISAYRTLTAQGREYIRQQIYVATKLYSGGAGVPVVENRKEG